MVKSHNCVTGRRLLEAEQLFDAESPSEWRTKNNFPNVVSNMFFRNLVARASSDRQMRVRACISLVVAAATVVYQRYISVRERNFSIYARGQTIWRWLSNFDVEKDKQN